MVSETDSAEGKIALSAWSLIMREAIGRAAKAVSAGAVERFGHLKEASNRGTAKALHDGLRVSHPIRVEAGFEGNPGVEGGAWRSADGGDDGLAHLRFAAGTEDLPLHVHEYSDRLLVVALGLGLFYYLPDVGKSRGLRSLMVEGGYAVLITRGRLHLHGAAERFDTAVVPLAVLLLRGRTATQIS